MYCHSEICYPGGMHMFANLHREGQRPLPVHERAGNGRVMCLPSLYHPLTVCHRFYPTGEKY